MGLSVVLTCFNEVPLIFDAHRELTSLLTHAGVEHEFVIVDDGSHADTRAALVAHFRGMPATDVILSASNEGRGAAVTRGIRASRHTFVGFTDTDLEIPGTSLLSLYREALGTAADVVLADRALTWNGNAGNAIRNVGSLVVRYATSWRLSLGTLDTATGAKVFRRDAILPVLDRVTDPRWFWDTEIVAEAVKAGLRVAQVPSPVYRRPDKKTSVRLVRDTWLQFIAVEAYRRRGAHRRVRA
jgi:glycosyltransferase involved in cell wall biosynthesis